MDPDGIDKTDAAMKELENKIPALLTESENPEEAVEKMNSEVDVLAAENNIPSHEVEKIKTSLENSVRRQTSVSFSLDTNMIISYSETFSNTFTESYHYSFQISETVIHVLHFYHKVSYLCLETSGS